jgi:putative Mg2+ transporter-C (MgtC) family protein
MSEALALPLSTVTVRLVLAMVLGGVIGLERERRDRPAGLRTHVLVTVAAALLMMLSRIVAGEDFDPGRMAAAVVTGIGFLGAGTIIHFGADVRGLTTAATVWAAAAVGLTVGLGWYPAAILATAVIFFTLTAMRWLERAIVGEHNERRVAIRLVPGSQSPAGLITELHRADVQVTGIDFTDEAGQQLILDCQVPRKMRKHALIELIVASDQVVSARIVC